MNKIYIKKRILKQIKKDEDLGTTSCPTLNKNESLTEIKRKRKMQRRLVHDDEDDQYCVNINNALSACSVSHFINNNTLAPSVSQEIPSVKSDPLPISSSDKISREEKKLQYYLDMIKRQEREENRQKSKQEEKFKKPIKQDSKISKKIFKNNNKPKAIEEIKINIVNGPDIELDALAQCISSNECSTLNNISQHASITWPDISIQMKENKDDLSCGQSDNQNESTFDRLRTPVQLLMKSPSHNGLDINNFILSNEQNNEVLNKDLQKSLKNDVCSKILLLTKRKQEEAKKSIIHNLGRMSEETSCTKMFLKNDNNLKCESDAPMSTRSLDICRNKLSLKYLKACKSQECTLLSFAIDSDSNNSPKSLKPVFHITREKNNET